LVDNRASLKLWMDTGAFPRGLKISGPTGETLVWLAIEVARLIERRVHERDESYAEKETGTPIRERPPDFDSDDSPLAASRNGESDASPEHFPFRLTIFLNMRGMQHTQPERFRQGERRSSCIDLSSSRGRP
jgi:hypothetical protein